MRTTAILFAVLSALFFASCEKGDIEVKRLYKGEGIWKIESLERSYYNAAGTGVDSSSTLSDVGEFVFFQNTTLNGLFEEHFMCLNLIDNLGNTQSYPGGVYFDANRVKISTDAGTSLDGVWTVDDDGRRKQVWSIYGMRPDGTLSEKWTMTLKKK
jgi:hypothetical protein